MTAYSIVVAQHITLVTLLRDEVRVLSDQQKMKKAKRYNQRVQSTSIQVKDLAMLYQKNVGKLKTR